MKLNLPEKIFNIESSLIVVCMPLLGVAVIFLVSIGQVVIPRIEEINGMVQEINLSKKNTADLVAKKNYLSTVNPEDLKKDSDFLANSLIREKDAYVLVRIVRRIADKYGFYVDSFSIQPGVIDGDGDSVQKEKAKGTSIVEKVPVSLTLLGPKDKYLDFIVGLEKSLPLLALDKMEMKEDPDVAQMELVVSSFYIGTKMEFNISNLTLADLTLSKEESELMKKLSGFDYDKELQLVDDGLKKQEFKKYELKNPFN